MSVTIQVTFDELPPAEQVRSFSESQNEPLLDLEAKYRTYVAERLPTEQSEHKSDSRHFWYNDEFQVHRGRTLYHIAAKSVIPLHFRRDTYLVSTPGHPEMDRIIDPELTVTEVLEWLHKNQMLGSTCCYEVVNSRGIVLNPDKTLYEQRALPYSDARKKEESHLRIRTRRALLRSAYLLMILFALLGGVLGWVLRHYGKF